MKKNLFTLFEDNHLHSTYSDGKHSIGELLEYNHFHDQLDLMISDHVNKETDWFSKYIEEIKQYRKQYPHFAIRIGCEVKILEDGTLNTRRDILDAAEAVIGSVHHFSNIKSLNKEELLEKEYELTKMLARNPDIDILGHPFSMIERFYKQAPPVEYVETVYKLCLENGIKFEFNPKHALEPVRELVMREIAKGNINNFSFGSDVHERCDEIGDAAFALAKPITVFVTGAGAGVGQSILKSLKFSKVKMRVIVGDISPLATGLYRAQAAYIIPLADDPAYLAALEKICKAEQVDVLLIGTDVELTIFSQNKEVFEKATGTRVIVSNPEAVAIADDKWKTVGFLKSNGFPYVRSTLVDNIDLFIKNAEFPVIVKPRIAARSVGFQIVPNEAELRSALQKDPNLIIQEYLSEEDEEYTCSAFFYDGACYGVAVLKRWLRNGDTYKAVVCREPEMEKFIKSVGADLRIVGPCNFQLRKSGGEFKIFEINCRFSGTTGAVSALGFNVANALLQKLFFSRPLRLLAIQEAYIFRYWNEVFVPPAEVALLAKQGKLEESHSDINLF